MALTIPNVDGLDTLTAALAYAEAGWYIGPLANGSKHPGSRLGDKWQTQTSRDAEVIVAWFAGTDDGIFLHCGRSGAIVFDVDTPEAVQGVLLAAIGDTQPPAQSTRTDRPGRGHYVFAQPPGRTLGNGLGRLPGGWGEIRGNNGVIVVEPTRHEKEADGGQYRWTRIGAVPMLPEAVAELLHDSSPGLDAATDADVRAFLGAHTEAARPELLDAWVTTFAQKVEAGESRHDRMVSICAGAMSEARAGYYPARAAMERLEEAFLDAVAKPGHGQQGKPRSPAAARCEWMGISAWAVAQANAADLGDVRGRVEEKMPDADDLSWIPGNHDSGDSSCGPRRHNPDWFFDKQDGVRIEQVTNAVLEEGPLGTDQTHTLYQYADGVWRRDGERIVRKRTAELLQDRYRVSYGNAVVDILRNRDPALDDRRHDTRHLNLPNGLLDWRTGQMHPHSPDVPSVVRIPVDWDPGAACPAIEQWMTQVFPPDAREFVEEVIGYALYDGNPFHKAVLCYGKGRNGKGTFLRLLQALIGEENISSVSPQSLDDNRFRAAELHGKIANLVGDVDPRIFKATEEFKKATGGDVITAERKNGHPFQFKCRALMIAAFNALPRSADTTDGFFSRWLVVPFAGYFPAGVADPSIEDKMHDPAELRGLLAMAVRGLARLMARGQFQLPESVEAESAEFRRVADPVRAFLDEYVPTLLVEWTARSEVYNAYTDWAQTNGYSSLAAASFYERVAAASNDIDGFTVSARTRNGTRGLLFEQKGTP